MVETNVNTGQVSNIPSTTNLGYLGHLQQPGHGSVSRSCQTQDYSASTTDNTAGYIYLSLTLIMSVLFSFTVVQFIMSVLCTIPAAIYAKQV